MKVFLSWSGEVSHKVAIVFRDWLPSVIQAIEPYVSSEDIDKGARWSTDIAEELENSTFGILCVTKENIQTPWLNFEAGALSKSMDKSYVSPFLFDIKRSEVNGPILQFQSTIFDKEDIKKLIITLNKACGEGLLTDERISKTFEVWYPSLENQLNDILNKLTKKHETEKSKEVKIPNEKNNINSDYILEEVLNISRINQKLLRTPDKFVETNLNEIKENIELIKNNLQRNSKENQIIRRNKFHPLFLEELLHMNTKFENSLMGIQITLSLFKNDYPWLYDSGIEITNKIKSNISKKEKEELVENFYYLMEFTFEHPVMREMYGNRDKELLMMGREIPRILRRSLENFIN
ncbi:TIR domain-containing protein [Aliarcobacter butzleri]|uniref:TIR domain-containing protein n=1 Tax=Aliarcobacter butzleri TaxID=28197 RepID=UPI003AF5F5D8